MLVDDFKFGGAGLTFGSLFFSHCSRALIIRYMNMLVYARLLNKRDELIKIIELLITHLKKKAVESGRVYESMQNLIDCRAQLIVIESKINFLLFGEH